MVLAPESRFCASLVAGFRDVAHWVCAWGSCRCGGLHWLCCANCSSCLCTLHKGSTWDDCPSPSSHPPCYACEDISWNNVFTALTDWLSQPLGCCSERAVNTLFHDVPLYIQSLMLPYCAKGAGRLQPGGHILPCAESALALSGQ